MIRNAEAVEEHFVENMDILMSNINFDVLKGAIQDTVLTTNQTASRMNCSLTVGINMFGLLAIGLPVMDKS